MAERASAARKATTKAAGKSAASTATKTAANKSSVAKAAKPAAPRKSAKQPTASKAAKPAGGGRSAAKAATKGATKSTAKTASKTVTKAAKAAAKGPTREEKAITRAASAKRTRSAADMEKIRVALIERRDELRTEHEQTLIEIADLQRDRLTDSAGDDQADTGTKTFEREQEISLANNILERITQVERALERVAEGNYGNCERCGNPIPVERLAAFPSATLCIPCKQLEERR